MCRWPEAGGDALRVALAGLYTPFIEVALVLSIFDTAFAAVLSRLVSTRSVSSRGACCCRGRGGIGVIFLASLAILGTLLLLEDVPFTEGGLVGGGVRSSFRGLDFVVLCLS